MKNSFLQRTVILFIFIAIFTSCNNDELLNKGDVTLKINTKSISNLKTINSIKAKLINDDGSFARTMETYDFENAEFVTSNTAQDTAIIVKQLNYSDRNKINSSLVIGYHNKEAFGEIFVVEVNNINFDNSLIEINIKTLENDIYSTVVLNNINQTTSVRNNNLSKKKPCGQAVMDCITDAYSNHGWASVALGITSAFVPHTFGVVAAACYDKNCK